MKLSIKGFDDSGILIAVYETMPTCDECRHFRKNFRLHYMSPRDDESPHACVHKNGMLHPWPHDWCSYGKEKDHE